MPIGQCRLPYETNERIKMKSTINKSETRYAEYKYMHGVMHTHRSLLLLDSVKLNRAEPHSVCVCVSQYM